MQPPDLPYCGAPPVPTDLAGRWNLDPVLIGAWLAVAIAAEVALHRSASSRAERRAFRAGWAVALAAWVSPLCALGVALFSARVAQHTLLVLVAAPLLAAAGPRRPRAPRAAMRSALAVGAAFAAAMWFWHAPVPYDATLRSTFAYWAMHATLLGTALLLWHELLRRTTAARPITLALAVVTSLQMGLLGALLTFAPAPIFESHLLTAQAFGLSPLEDQQLGGLVLWIPGCGALLAFAAASFAAWLRELEPTPPSAPL